MAKESTEGEGYGSTPMSQSSAKQWDDAEKLRIQLCVCVYSEETGPTYTVSFRSSRALNETPIPRFMGIQLWFWPM